jgi:GNAT superfamily N-acetyltransferase
MLSPITADSLGFLLYCSYPVIAATANDSAETRSANNATISDADTWPPQALKDSDDYSYSRSGPRYLCGMGHSSKQVVIEYIVGIGGIYAPWHGEFAGYVTLLWVSDYGPFAKRQIPEISDLNVLPPHRRQGIGNALLDRAESAASARSKVVGLGVGLYSDYGAAKDLRAARLPPRRPGHHVPQPAGTTGCDHRRRCRRHSHAHPTGRMTVPCRAPARGTPRTRTG